MEGFDLINEALNLLNNVYGALHVEIEACTHLLARLNYIMGDYAEVYVYTVHATLFILPLASIYNLTTTGPLQCYPSTTSITH